MVRTPLALALTLVLTACATLPADGSSKAQTGAQANRENMKGAMAAPLRDVNVLRTKIPDVLLQAMADPYGRPEPASCSELAALILPLNGALGADLDEPVQDEDDLLAHGREGALGVVASVTSGVVPFRGWVRKLSGAEQHEHLVQAAVSAGAVRRAYLKGLGEARGCNPPATPSHVLQGREPISETRKPRYPIR